MRHLDLFSGIGGFALAAEWVWPDVQHVFCEIDPFCQDVLEKHWPDAPIYGDIRELTRDRYSRDFGDPAVDLLTGGFPCQPFSVAGARLAQGDHRYLWPEMLRVIEEFRPRWIIGQNVAGIVKLALDEVLTDLEGANYSCQAFIIPACAVRAPHRRDRVWIVAHSNSQRLPRRQDQTSSSQERENSQQQLARLLPPNFWNHLPQPDPYRMDDGLSRETHRNHALGNAIVPQVAAELMAAIRHTQ